MPLFRELLEPRPKPFDKAADTAGCMVALVPTGPEAAALAIKDGEPAPRLHVTLAYLGKAASVDEALVNKVVAAWAAGTAPIDATITGRAIFGDGKKEIATVGTVSAPALDNVRPALVDALENAGVDVSREYSFNPHMTFGYGEHFAGANMNLGNAGKRLRFRDVRVVHAGNETTHALEGVAKRHTVPNRPGVTNWVQENGGLPRAIEDVAGAILDDPSSKIKDVSHAIATAVSRAKVWAAQGNAKYVKAVAQWYKLRAKAKLSKAARGLSDVDAVLAIPVDDRRAMVKSFEAEEIIAEAGPGPREVGGVAGLLRKDTFEEHEHPRWPKGTPGIGGKFCPSGMPEFARNVASKVLSKLESGNPSHAAIAEKFQDAAQKEDWSSGGVPKVKKLLNDIVVEGLRSGGAPETPDTDGRPAGVVDNVHELPKGSVIEVGKGEWASKVTLVDDPVKPGAPRKGMDEKSGQVLTMPTDGYGNSRLVSRGDGETPKGYDPEPSRQSGPSAEQRKGEAGRSGAAQVADMGIADLNSRWIALNRNKERTPAQEEEFKAVNARLDEINAEGKGTKIGKPTPRSRPNVAARGEGRDRDADAEDSDEAVEDAGGGERASEGDAVGEARAARSEENAWRREASKPKTPAQLSRLSTADLEELARGGGPDAAAARALIADRRSNARNAQRSERTDESPFVVGDEVGVNGIEGLGTIVTDDGEDDGSYEIEFPGMTNPARVDTNDIHLIVPKIAPRKQIRAKVLPKGSRNQIVTPQGEVREL